MSHQTEGWATTYSPYTGTMFQVHKGIAEIANDTYNYEFFMSLPRFAEKIRVSERSCQRALHQLVADGFLEIVQEADPATWRPTTYRFLMPEVAAVYAPKRRTTPDTIPPPGDDTMSPPGDNKAPPLVPDRHHPGAAMAPRSQVGSQGEDPKVGERATNTRARRWRVVPPDEATLSEARIRIGLETGLSRSQAERQWVLFTGHEFATPKSDVDRTWRNWCVKEADWHRRDTARDADRQQQDRARAAESRGPSELSRLAVKDYARVVPGVEATRRMLRERGL